VVPAIPFATALALHTVPVVLLAWTQFELSVNSQSVKLVKRTPSPRWFRFTLALSVAAIAIPGLLVTLAYVRDPPHPSAGTVSGGLFFAIVAMAGIPIILAGAVGCVVSIAVLYKINRRQSKSGLDPTKDSK
jgi:hypothetical protein